jgi:hypothetical protein
VRHATAASASAHERLAGHFSVHFDAEAPAHLCPHFVSSATQTTRPDLAHIWDSASAALPDGR